MSERTTTPAEAELRLALLALRAHHPELGVAKLHAALLQSQPEWLVSEKRARKLLQDSTSDAPTSGAAPDDAPDAPSSSNHTAPNDIGIDANPTSAPSKKKKKKPAKRAAEEEGLEPGRTYPESREIDGLDIAQWTDKVEVRMFGRGKGKGLVARVPIAEGEVIWKEDPWIIAPEWEIYDLQTASRACGHCTTPLAPDAPLATPCPSSTSAAFCPLRFCNRVCARRAEGVHPLLCPARNPACAPLRRFVRDAQGGWLALHAFANAAARVLLAAQAGGGGGGGSADGWRKDWAVYQGLAVLGMEERAKDEWMAGAKPDRALWKKAHQLLVHAFHAPPADADKKKLAKILRRPAPDEVAAELFSYDGFLRGLGRMSLNIEAHGGVYTLHSHLNHACAPAVSVRHLDQRAALARITVVARAALAPGAELTATYVDPTLALRARRRKLREWGFGACRCARCVAEEREMLERGEAVDEGGDELAEELKMGFGVD